jgi:hypothetical protein
VRRTKTLFAAGLGLAAFAAWLASCGPSGFQDEALVNGVRILATQAVLPCEDAGADAGPVSCSYAKPGDTVTVRVLAADGRANKPEPMVIYWFPISLAGPLTLPLPTADFVCEDPANDAYYACFASLVDGGAPADGGTGGVGEGGSKLALGPGVDLSPFLPQGPTFSVPLSEDIITKHPPVTGTTYPYGIAIVFNMACAGHPELLPPNSSNLSFNQLPVGCFDSSGNLLDADSYVVGYATIYAYETLTNQNPVISQMVYQGKNMDGGFSGDSSVADVASFGDAGIVVPPCTNDCPTYSFNVVVPQSSWEIDPQDLGPNGQPLHEQIWVDYYWTAGTFSDDSRLVYDPTLGFVGGTAVSMTAPSSPTPATFWAVVHDNRGGVAWDVVPFTVR